LSAPGRNGRAVDTTGQQRVGELHPVAVDLHDSVAFSLLEEFDDALRGRFGDLGD
jgi:hypothetical protein